MLSLTSRFMSYLETDNDLVAPPTGLEGPYWVTKRHRLIASLVALPQLYQHKMHLYLTMILAKDSRREQLACENVILKYMPDDPYTQEIDLSAHTR